MREDPESASQQWDLEAWQDALTIHVGSAWGCRECGNLVMITRGGVGVLRLRCCGQPMEKVVDDRGESEESP